VGVGSEHGAEAGQRGGVFTVALKLAAEAK
jgi:hypothetical protein